MKPFSQAIILAILSFIFTIIAILFSVWDGERYVPLLCVFASILALISIYVSYKGFQRKNS